MGESAPDSSPEAHVHDWKRGKFLGVEDDRYCFGCHQWESDTERKEVTREPYPEAEQDRDLRELSRCPECQTTFGGHLTSCSKTFDALDFWGAEWSPSEEDVG